VTAIAGQPAAERLKITEVFCSIQGEARDAGWPSVFIRLTGCPLRCQYCDTAYAFHGGEWRELSDLMAQVETFAVQHVCVTGGEPLAQRRCLDLLTRLCDAGYTVSLETSGALDISGVDSRVQRVVDIKTPGSGEVERNLWGNVDLLTDHDAVKFVICNRDDYVWCRERLQQQLSGVPCPVFLSPSSEEQAATALADWVVEDRLPVRLQIQMHKVLWGAEPGR
jgi:7-carboxy-7-deazaguanine synthase